VAAAADPLKPPLRAADPQGVMSRFGPTVRSVAPLTLMAVALLAGPLYGAWELCAALLAACCAVVMARARIAESAAAAWEQRACHDPLTGVGNYRQLHERLEQTVAADPERFALLTMDVDSFKQINDVHGHPEGDRLLREVGRVLCESVRGDDLIARQGGDEFAVLAGGTDAQAAAALAARIERALTRVRDAEDRPVRASIGVALYPGDGRTADDLLHHADAVLREVKSARYAADPSVPHRRRGDLPVPSQTAPGQAR